MEIEICVDVKIEASIAFWVEPEEWEAMTLEERQARAESAALSIQRKHDNEVFRTSGCEDLRFVIVKTGDVRTA